MKKAITILLFFLIAAIHVAGQKYYSRNYDISSGLPDNCIRDIHQDSRGFLWIGTDAGLTKFDGKNFTIFSSQDGLAGNHIRTITERNNGNIWIGCYDGGVSVFDGNKINSFTEESGLISNKVQVLHYSRKYDIIIIGTDDGLSVYQNNKFVSFHADLHNVNTRLQITSVLEYNDQIFIFTNEDNLYKYIPETESLIRLPANHDLNKKYSNSAYISALGDTLINVKGFNLLTKRKSSIAVQKNIGEILDYVEDASQNIWIASWDRGYKQSGGLFKYDSTGIVNFGNHIGIESTHILSLEFDSKENLLWIGTKDHGLYLYPLTNFAYYKQDDFNLDKLDIRDLKTDQSKNLWICTNNKVIKKKPDNTYKIFSFDLFNDQFTVFAKKTLKRKYSYLNDKDGSYKKYEDLIASGKYLFSNPYKRNKKEYAPGSLYKPLKYEVLVNKSLSEFNSLIQDSIGNLWVGSNAGIFKINKNSEKVEYYDLDGNQFKKFYFDQNNKLYGLSWSELFIYADIENTKEHLYFDYYEDKSPINVTSIKSLNDQVWFTSSDHGLFVYDGTRFYSSEQAINTLSLNDLAIDQHNNIIAAGNNGIAYIVGLHDNAIKLYHTINLYERKLGVNIRYLEVNENNQLIAGTNKGLQIIELNDLYERGELNIKSIKKSQGFTDYSGKVSTIQDQYYLWVGSNKNLVKIKLADLKNISDQHYNFFIKSIYVNDEPHTIAAKHKNSWTHIPASGINLPYYKNSITIHFDIVRFLDHDYCAFSYKLEGFHNQWIDDVQEGKAIFQNLKPGKYIFRVKLTDLHNSSSTQELAINFNIEKPLWLKWWAILAALVLLGLLIRMFVLIRTRSIKKRERLRSEITERITEFELKALRSQMNPHFIFNAINSIQNYMLDNDIDSALNYLSDFAKLIRLTLDNVSKKRITLDEELNYLKYYIKLEQMRFDKKFELVINMPGEIENTKVLIPSMILQPYIENSIKHGFAFKESGGIIKLKFKLSENNILNCIIEDNGIGRKKSRELNKNKNKHQSKGTFITAERLSLLNQTQPRKGFKVETIDLYDEFNLPSGTRVEISIPI